MARYEQSNGSRGPPSKRGRLEGRVGGVGGGSSEGRRSHARNGTWLPMEVEEELARCDPDQRPNHILLFTILNAQYTIDVSIMYKVCSPMGKVQRIVVFRKGSVVHAMVEFDSVETASQAKRQLHGCDIYSGCCTLKVEFARTDRLHVKRNDDLTWDYTDEFARGGGGNMSMGGGGGSRADRPVLLNEPPKMAANSMGMGGAGGMGMGVAGAGNLGFGGMGGGMMGMGGMGAMSGGMGGMSGGMGGMSGGMGAMGGGMAGMGGMGAMGGMGGGGLAASMMNRSRGDSYGGMSSGVGMGGGGGNYGGRSSVVMMYGAEPDKFNCQRVFNLLCQYGNVQKVMFMKNKEGIVMVEMGDPDSVQRVIDNLSNTAIFGLKLRFDWSKKECINEIRNPFELPDGTDSYASFERDRNNRFDTPEKAAKNRVIAPSKSLHFYNVPKLEDADMEAVFASKEAPIPARIRWFPSSTDKSATGVAEFDSVQEAAEALVLCNHAQVDGPNVKYPYIMKLCFSREGGPGGRGGGGDRR